MFVEGTLDVPSAEVVLRHADECGACRRALAELARSAPLVAGPSIAGAPAPAPVLEARLNAVLAPGDLVAARYRVERLLAVGGMGAVYVAQHVETEQRVALKVLLAGASASEQAILGFRLEARVFSRIPGDHIVRVFDAGIDADRKIAFIVMELLQGETLGGIVRARGPIAPAMLVPIVLQAASALDAAHAATDGEGRSAPIVHRDLKPDNVFVVAGGAEPHAKLLDFGIAKIASAASLASQEVRGTPQYMAPEQIEGRAVQAQTDVAALGLTVFFCLTGRSYWKAASARDATMSSLLREILAGTGTPASARARDLGVEGVELAPEFDAWFARATAHDPGTRFRSAGEAALVLAQALGLPAATAGAFSAVLLPAPPARRSPRARVVAMVIVLGVVGALALIGAYATMTRPGSAGAAAVSKDPGIPPGTSPEAVKAFADARAALRDGQLDRCVRSLKQAVAVAPELASAQVWLTALSTLRYNYASRYNYVTDLGLARDALEAASLHRDTLEPREHALFQGFQRMLSVEPPDPAALVTAIEPYARDNPQDLVVRLVLARGLHALARFDDAKAELRDVLARDPEFAAAYTVLAQIHESSVDYDARRAVLETCIQRVPRAMSCLLNRNYVSGLSCAEVEANARQMVAVLPSSPSGYTLLAQTLVTENRPEREILAVLERRVARMTVSERERSDWQVQAAVAFEYGHFEKADALAAEGAARFPSDLELTPRAYWLRLLIAEEVGDRELASTLVQAMRSHAILWTEESTASGELLVHAVRSGAIDQATFEKERAAFRASVPSAWRVAPSSKEVAAFDRWIDGDARTVLTDDDARAADANFEAGALRFRPRWEREVVEAGAVFLQSGDLARAKEVLGRSLCDLHPERPGVAMRRSLLLGRTLEATGDRAGACTSYGQVLARWGQAPRSVTAGEARGAVNRLACPR
jgi:serine/threonine-protein kinase